MVLTSEMIMPLSNKIREGGYFHTGDAEGAGLLAWSEASNGEKSSVSRVTLYEDTVGRICQKDTFTLCDAAIKEEEAPILLIAQLRSDIGVFIIRGTRIKHHSQ